MGISFHFDRTRADEKTEAVAPVFSDVGVDAESSPMPEERTYGGGMVLRTDNLVKKYGKRTVGFQEYRVAPRVYAASSATRLGYYPPH